MPQSDLFPSAASLSPRLAWMRAHSLVCVAEDPAIVGQESPETGDEVAAWYCLRADESGCMVEQPLELIGRGDDEEGACLDFARKNNIPTWHTS